MFRPAWTNPPPRFIGVGHKAVGWVCRSAGIGASNAQEPETPAHGRGDGDPDQGCVVPTPTTPSRRRLRVRLADLGLRALDRPPSG